MDDEQRALNKWLADAANATQRVRDQYIELADHVETVTVVDHSGIRSPSVNPSLPINASVIDLRAAIDKHAAKYAGRVYEALRMGVEGGLLGTDTRLRFLAGVLPRLHAADADLCAEVVGRTWRLHNRATNLLDPPTEKKPFAVDDLCPECGLMSLWVVPADWTIVCAMPDCGHRRTIPGTVTEPLPDSPIRGTGGGLRSPSVG